MSRVALLDVNVLVALFDAGHVHHDLAHDWFAEYETHGWATCPLTQNGLLRVICSAAYAVPPHRPLDVAAALATFCGSRPHHFRPDDGSLIDAALFDAALIKGHRQVSDIYLLGLAKKHGGALATFDRTIPPASVRGATTRTLEVITAAAAE